MFQSEVIRDVPAATNEELRKALAFTHFEAGLIISYDHFASSVLGKDYWRVTQPFKFYVGERSQNVWAYVPAGFLTDGATAPRLFWAIIPPWGDYGQAAVLHDILCETLTLTRNEQKITITRKQADDIFYEAMKAAGVNWAIRSLIYAAVRVYAWTGWGRNEEKLAQKQKLEQTWGQAGTKTA